MPKKAKKSQKRVKYHTDEQGHYVWENYFVRGKQRRSKLRVTVIDGEIIDDPDEWLLVNADDIFLHQCELWDLIEQRQLADEGPQPGEQAMKPPPRQLRIDIVELETVFEYISTADPGFDDEPCSSFLDLTTGKVVMLEDGEETEGLWTTRCRSTFWHASRASCSARRCKPATAAPPMSFSAIRKANTSAASAHEKHVSRASGRVARPSTANGGPFSATISRTFNSIPLSSPDRRSNSGLKSSPAPICRTTCGRYWSHKCDHLY